LSLRAERISFIRLIRRSGTAVFSPHPVYLRVDAILLHKFRTAKNSPRVIHPPLWSMPYRNPSFRALEGYAGEPCLRFAPFGTGLRAIYKPAIRADHSYRFSSLNRCLYTFVFDFIRCLTVIVFTTPVEVLFNHKNHPYLINLQFRRIQFHYLHIF
jgi:hypothetical protein